MKGIGTLIAVQALLATVSGVLISQMSFVGKMGISVLYSQYNVFKIWWKIALLLFAIQLALIFVLWLVKVRLSGRMAFITILLFLIAGLIGSYFTYLDFTTTTHRLMKARFHSGGYLFWGAWGLSCIYFIMMRIVRKPIDQQAMPAATEPGAINAAISQGPPTPPPPLP
ncbi:hypothetical protein JHJ32_17225 [Parapedobacter sp. ISTM3]|uniref:Uncharacterized protein n=1 Tax=Parapedobacter luteus TaxID=623280 RepID=A0A1T5AKN8_9SPHI|nr:MULTISPECIES: hypothetical protein [Parapedobacter]MBK1441744.1 hypothetical protein [Parapedobacter sp. ISTM3]SKB35173.1 hypothetical protein SAMN05660226_00825 [Parapedobacter luteus]